MITNSVAELTKTCQGCGSQYAPIGRQLYCTRPCRRRYKYLKHGEYELRRYENQCYWCDSTFKCQRIDQRFCSRKCNERWRYREDRQSTIDRVNAWAADNPERFRNRMADARGRRRARIAEARTYQVGQRDLRRLRHRQNGHCAYCSLRAALTLEHVIPLARGGVHSIGNLTLVCRSCNCSKRDRLLIEWRARHKNIHFGHMPPHDGKHGHD